MIQQINKKFKSNFKHMSGLGYLLKINYKHMKHHIIPLVKKSRIRKQRSNVTVRKRKKPQLQKKD